jgi:colanic acid/amylovoran biosynthesis glycosyltransferase
MDHERIRVIHSYPIWLPLTQTWMFNQVKYLPASVETHVVCEITEHLDQFYVPNIHCLHEKSWLGQKWEKTLRNLSIRTGFGFLATVARKTRTQIIHSHFGNIGWINQKAVQQLSARHVVTYYGYDVNMLPMQDKKWLARYRDLFNTADAFLCEGPFMGKQLVQMGCPQKKVNIHHLGVETDKIPFLPRHWHSNEPFRVLIAASFVEKKGIPYALQALAQINQKIQLSITIIGDANPKLRDNSEKEKILEVIRQGKLSENTRLLGFKPYSVLFEEAYKHHLFISPSVTSSDGNTEGGAPVTLIEMMATGMPVISTSHCDIPEVVQYGIDDWLVEERDVSSLVKKIQWLIDHSTEWDNMVEKGRKHVELEFNAVHQGERLEKIYRDVITP